MSVKVRTYETHAGIRGDSGVEVRVVSGRKSPFRFRSEIISQRGNATGLSVTTIMVNNAVRGYSHNVNDCGGYFYTQKMFRSRFRSPRITAHDHIGRNNLTFCIDI